MENPLVILNLPLRRRCLYLTDLNFLAVAFSSDDVHAATAPNTLLKLHQIIVAHKRRLEVVCASSSLLLPDNLSDALEKLSCLTSGNPTAPCLTSQHARLSWTAQLEVLQSSLEMEGNLASQQAEVVHDLCCALVEALYEKGQVYYEFMEKQQRRSKRHRMDGARPLFALKSESAELEATAAATPEVDGGKSSRITWSIAEPVQECVWKLFADDVAH